jgi:hypothetical protein
MQTMHLQHFPKDYIAANVNGYGVVNSARVLDAIRLDLLGDKLASCGWQLRLDSTQGLEWGM